jgi:pimeloyl-ACP methyl ester carboxylesterase
LLPGNALRTGLILGGTSYLQDLLLPMNLSDAWLLPQLKNLDAIKRQGWLINDVYALQNLMESFLGFEVLTNRLNSIRLPTMILNGEFDFLTPRSLHDTLRTQIPNSALIISFPAPFTPLRWRRQPCRFRTARTLDDVADSVAPKPVEGITDLRQGLLIGLASLAHAAHGAIRQAALLPPEADPKDAFASALRRIEFENSRLIQAQILFLKGPELAPLREAVSSAVEQRHQQVRQLWEAMLTGIGVQRKAKN